jgi:hypothetical protein
MNIHQQQLLQLLQITPLKLHANFHLDQRESNSLLETTIQQAAEQVPLLQSDISALSPELTRLADDIQRALAEFHPTLQWRYFTQVQQPCFQQDELWLPELKHLAMPEQKQQLWRLLTELQVQRSEAVIE